MKECKTNTQRQSTLISYWKENNSTIPEHKNIPLINFITVQQWDDENTSSIKDEIRELRKECLHNIISIDGSYRLKVMPGTLLASALGIHEKLGKDRHAFNSYDPELEN